MPDLAADLRAMIASSDFGTGEPRVCQIGGVDVPCLPSRSTEQDALMGDTSTSGKIRVLRIARADAPDLEAGTVLTWNGQDWIVTQAQTIGLGSMVRAFLGKPRP